MDNNYKSSEDTLADLLSAALKIPGVKVDRNTFLRRSFSHYSEKELSVLLEAGPVRYGCPRKELKEKAEKIVRERIMISSGASFLAGLPGGLLMAATIPADAVQSFGISLRLAQELAYLYGEDDLWAGDSDDDQRAREKLIIYIGAMIGVTGAVSLVRIMSSGIARKAINKLPQMAITRSIIFPIVKNCAKVFGVSMTKSTFAKGISKIVPVVGGVVSGGITYASMKKMGFRLAETLDQASFGYSEDELEADWSVVDDLLEKNAKAHEETDNP